MQYRSEIDGLRAIAILPVLFFHAGFPWASGGFIGVDVFFVISGYLITSIILSDLKSNKFNFKIFYERRARRILPALFVMAFVCLLFAYFLMSPKELASFFKSLISTISYVSNIFFLTEINYFDGNAELKPLLHTWSLSVEEQFYVFFPLFLYLLFRFVKSIEIHIATIFFLLILFLFMVSIVGYNISNSAAFYLLPTRAWELLSGSYLAAFHYLPASSRYFTLRDYLVSNISPENIKNIKNILSILGIVFM